MTRKPHKFEPREDSGGFPPTWSCKHCGRPMKEHK